MSADPLESARAKLCRAKDHLGVFDELAKGFLEGEPYGFTREFKDQGFEQIFRVEVRRAPPAKLPLICGDVLHNARAALDHAVWGLATDHCPTLSEEERRRLQFPIVGDVSSFKEQKRRGRLLGVPAKQRIEIQRLQPYYNAWPNVWLSLLSELDNTDKHRAVHVVAGAIQYFASSTIPGRELKWRQGRLFLKETGAEICTAFFVPPKAHVDVAFDPKWQLVIESRQIPTGVVDSATDTMWGIVNAVGEVLDRLSGC